MFDFYSKFSHGLQYHDFLATHGSPQHRERWEQVRIRVKLTETQREILGGFVRDIKMLCLAGAWCGDCVNQCPIFQAFVEAAPKTAGSPKIDLRFFDRDAHPDLQAALQLCGGNRVPVLVFLSEEGRFCGLHGDRTLAKYR